MTLNGNENGPFIAISSASPSKSKGSCDPTNKIRKTQTNDRYDDNKRWPCDYYYGGVVPF